MDEQFFEDVPCPLCGSEGGAVTYPIDRQYAEKLSGVHVVRDMKIGVAICTSCAHQFIHPCPRPEFLTLYYSVYMTAAKNGFYRARQANDIPATFQAHYQPWLVQMRNLLTTNAPVLLDIGCGLGMFLRLARGNGFIVRGLEPNADAVHYLKTEHDIHAYNALLESYSGSEKFDVISMWDLLEHLAHPTAAIKQVHAMLNPSGLLALEIPVRDSLLHWVAKALFRLSFGRVTRPLFLTYGVHHLQYFSEKSIVSFLEGNGFDVCECNRAETDISALKRSDSSLKGWSYNIVLGSLFFFAKIIKKENKIIVLARKK